MSTRELLARLPPEIETRLIRSRPEHGLSAYVRRRATNLSVKLGGIDSDEGLERVLSRWSQSPTECVSGSSLPVYTEYSCVAVENSARWMMAEWAPDVVVASSLDRMAWRRLRRATLRSGVPTVLYLREEALLPHLELGAPADLVLANSRGLVESAQSEGWRASFVPSVINLNAAKVDSSRTTCLLLNPTVDYGLDRAVALAELCPAVPFVFQESTKLTVTQTDRVRSIAARLSNVEARRFTSDVSQVYRDARVFLAPYTGALHSNRPRSVLEAHVNGIPVFGADRPGLKDATGSGGVLLGDVADDAEWATNLARFFDDEAWYRRMVEAAHANALRVDVDPDRVAGSFVETIERVIGGTGAQ